MMTDSNFNILGAVKAKPIIFIPNIPSPCIVVEQLTNDNKINTGIVAVKNSIFDDKTFDDSAQEEIFWNMINDLRWMNKSDGVVQPDDVKKVMLKWQPFQLRIFKTKYSYYFHTMYKHLINVQIIDDKNEIDLSTEITKNISHIIALGYRTWMVVYIDPSFYYFFIENNECQSLNDLLPEQIQQVIIPQRKNM